MTVDPKWSCLLHQGSGTVLGGGGKDNQSQRMRRAVVLMYLLVQDLHRSSQPQFQMGSHKILVSLKSHSGGMVKSWGQESEDPIQDLKRGQVKMVEGVPG